MVQEMIIVAGIHIGAMLLPGPDFAVLLTNALSGLRKRVVLVSLGYAAACVVHSILVISGLWLILLKHSFFSNYLAYFGAAFFIFMGVSVIKKQANYQTEINNAHTWSFVHGFLANISNPKAIVYFIALYSQIIDPWTTVHEKAGWIVYIFVLSWLGAFLIGLVILRVGNIFLNDRIQLRLQKIVGWVLVIIGLGMLISQPLILASE